MRSQLLRRVLLAVVVLAVLAAIFPALRYYHYFETHVSTDDAYVDGTVALVSSRVSGTVVDVYAEDNWTVKQGDLLLALDPRDAEVRVDQARAQLDRARQSVDEIYAQISAAEAGVSLAASQLKQARIDFERARQLKASGVVSAEAYDQADTGLRVALAEQALADHQLTQARAALGGASQDHSGQNISQQDHTVEDHLAADRTRADNVRYDRPMVKQAEAALEAAKLDLAYTKITAPFAGIVTHKTAHIGHRVQAGEPLLAIVPLRNLYITANFKETQLTDVRVGQSADVEADIYPGYVYHGHVDSISMGTGAAFSLLPPENATGNWVKVVQRVPVKIVLDSPIPEDKPLRLGLSVEVAINVGDTRGPLLSSIVQRRFNQGATTLPNESLTVPALPEPGSQDRPEGSAEAPAGQPQIQNPLH
jgi:membrane fusion protein, multidrug efflux system